MEVKALPSSSLALQRMEGSSATSKQPLSSPALLPRRG